MSVTPQVREASGIGERASTTFDVRTLGRRSRLGGLTGVGLECRSTPDPGEVLAGVRSMPGAVRVTHEGRANGIRAGSFPWGAEGVECLVTAPAKPQRPSPG